MKLPDNYSTLPESDGSGGKIQPPPDSYVCRVIRVKFQLSKSARPMLVFDFDIAEGPFSKFFSDDNDDRAAKNFEPRWLRLYQLVDGKAASVFKGLLKNFERSNDGYSVEQHTVGEEFDEKSLEGKLIGLVCAGEEYQYNDQIRMSLKPDRSLTVEKVRARDVPEARIKGVDGAWRKASEPPPPATKPGTNELSDVSDVDIPF